MAVSLREAFANVPDPRSRHGRRFPLVPILCLVTLGLLAGRQSLKAILQMRQDYGDALPLALGFPRCRFPSETALARLLARLDVTALEAALSAWLLARLSPQEVARILLDGKTLRGSRDGEVPGQHLVAAYAPDADAVLAQLRVDAKTNEHKAALELLGILPLKGAILSGDALFCQRASRGERVLGSLFAILSGDALFCQRDVAAVIDAGGGDYVLTVKANQRGLEVDIGAGFGFEEAARSLAAAFSPGTSASAGQSRGADGGEGARANGEAKTGDDADVDVAPPVAWIETGVQDHADADGEGQDDDGGGVRDHEFDGGGSGREAFAGFGAGTLGDRERPALGA